MSNSKKSVRTAAILLPCLFMSSLTWAQFDTAKVIFEQNATDGDAEVVFAMTGGDEGIETLLVLAPNNRVVVNSSTVSGMREFLFESPEPEDAEEIKVLYPEGYYLFFATTSSGVVNQVEVLLTHELPAVSSFISPTEEQSGVPLNLMVSWTPVPGITNYILEIENDDLGESLTMTVQSSVTSLQVPGGFLVPNTEYEIQIGTVAANGNTSFIETSFTTQ